MFALAPTKDKLCLFLFLKIEDMVSELSQGFSASVMNIITIIAILHQHLNQSKILSFGKGLMHLCDATSLSQTSSGFYVSAV